MGIRYGDKQVNARDWYTARLKHTANSRRFTVTVRTAEKARLVLGFQSLSTVFICDAGDGTHILKVCWPLVIPWHLQKAMNKYYKSHEWGENSYRDEVASSGYISEMDSSPLWISSNIVPSVSSEKRGKQNSTL